MLQCDIFPGLPPDFLDSEVNLFLVPFMDSETESENPPRAGGSLRGGTGHALAWASGPGSTGAARPAPPDLPAPSRPRLQPALLPAPRVPRSPQFPVIGEQTPQPSDVHGPAAAVAHHPHREELVGAPGAPCEVPQPERSLQTPVLAGQDPHFADGVSVLSPVGLVGNLF